MHSAATAKPNHEMEVEVTASRQHIETIVIGAGQAGLAVGHHLAQRRMPFLIVDANQRIGAAWRKRWESLRLFTPARYDGLDGMPFPAAPDYFPTKDEMADYLESYARHFDLPVRLGFAVDRLSRHRVGYMIASGDTVISADNVVVAMGSYQQGKPPPFAHELGAAILQMHSVDYRQPSQLKPGNVLVVGAANSGAEIALDLARHQRVWLAGRHPGHIPFDVESWLGRHWLARLAIGGVEHRLLTVANPIGRRARPKVLSKGVPLIRSKPKDLIRAGVTSVPRVIGSRDGLPLLEDDRALDVANVVWCTGFSPGFSWIDIDVLDGEQPRHRSGIVGESPGLYFVGLEFLHAISSAMIHGVNRDAARVVAAIAARHRQWESDSRMQHTSP